MKTEIVPGMSDHSAVITYIDLKPKTYRKTPHNIHQYKHADFDKLRDDLVSFSRTFLENTPFARSLDENWSLLKQALLTGIKDHIPTKMTKTNRSLPWITSDIKSMIRRKDRAYRKARKTKSHSDWDAYKTCRNKTQKMQGKSSELV